MYISQPSLDLSGLWNFKPDPQDQGVLEDWHQCLWTESDQINLPGSLQEQGFGDKPGLHTEWTGRIVDPSYYESDRYAPFRQDGNIKYPCWLTPERVYKGAAWYQRKLSLPREWMGKTWSVILERCHWTTRLWVNGIEQGFQDSLSVEHRFSIEASEQLEVTLTLCVDNRLHVDVGPNSHSVSDHTQTNWNGVIGSMQAVLNQPHPIKNVYIDPDPENQKVAFRIQRHPDFTETCSCSLQIEGSDFKSRIPPVLFSIHPDENEYVLEAGLGPDSRTWTPQHPNLYEVTIRNEEEMLYKEHFGMIRMSTQQQSFLLNGIPCFLRGTLDCAVFPSTGYPPMDVDSWKEILSASKSHGLNHIRFHSWCPPEAAFQAGDELGLIFQVECPTWPNTSSSVGDGSPIDSWLYEEAERIIQTYGNHPCFRLFAMGNEPAGPKEPKQPYSDAQWGSAYLSKWCSHWKQQDPRRLHTSAGGWPKVLESDFHNVPEPRIQGWGEGMDSIINSEAPRSDYTWANKIEKDKPTLSHEIGQWCAFPDFSEIPKYTGLLKAKNFEVFQTFLDEVGMLDQAEVFLQASGRLQTLCYKAEIEAALRTPGFGGFQLLGLQDFPGQGTALVGVLNAFWKSKGYVEADTFQEFCGDTVPLAALPRHIFTSGETLAADLLVSHFGTESIECLDLKWSLKSSEATVEMSGGCDPVTLPAGSVCKVGSLSIPLPDVEHAVQCELLLEVHKPSVRNRWSVFLYPKQIPRIGTPDILVTDECTPELEQHLQEGGNAWLQLSPDRIATEIQSGFSTIFWNTAWTERQPPHTLGILCDPEDPALAGFPTESSSDWQWWGPLHYSRVMELNKLTGKVTNLVQMIPDWFDPKPLSLVFEVKIGSGRLLVSSIDFKTDIEQDPARRQLSFSLETYIAGSHFHPVHACEFKNLSILTR